MQKGGRFFPDFTLSTTDFQTLRGSQTLETREEFAERHIYFLEDGPTAIQEMLDLTQP